MWCFLPLILNCCSQDKLFICRGCASSTKSSINSTLWHLLCSATFFVFSLSLFSCWYYSIFIQHDELPNSAYTAFAYVVSTSHFCIHCLSDTYFHILLLYRHICCQRECCTSCFLHLVFPLRQQCEKYAFPRTMHPLCKPASICSMWMNEI